MIGAERALAVRGDQLVRQHRPDVVVGEFLHLGHFVRRAEPVEEVDQREARSQGGRLADQREVVGLLHRAARQQRAAGLPDGHDVGVVAEDRQRVGGHRAGRHVHAERGQLARDLVEVRDHQQQALAGREGRRQRASLQRPVDRADGAAFGLHLHHFRHHAPHVLAALGGPLVGEFAHVGRGGDGVDGDDFVAAVGHRGSRLVAVNRDPVSTHDVVSTRNGRRGPGPRWTFRRSGFCAATFVLKPGSPDLGRFPGNARTRPPGLPEIRQPFC